MARRKKKHDEEHENLERWLVSYADFITLLFAFFVTMYAISRVDEQKLGSAVESLQRALGSLIPVQISQRDAGAFTPTSTPIGKGIINDLDIRLAERERKAFEKLVAEIQKQIEDNLMGIEQRKRPPFNQIKYILEKRGLVIRVPDSLFFNSGEASIRPEFIPILNALGKSLETIPNLIRIEGHTDSVPIQTVKFPSNWELSTARATTVVRYFLSNFNFKPEKLSATGFAEFRPIAPNSTPEGRALNRRVDVVILSSLEENFEPKQGESTDKNINPEGGKFSPPHNLPPPTQFPRPSQTGV
ncbi:MAG: flagellar motor protein MotB [Thermodesulfobacteriota bacterium]